MSAPKVGLVAVLLLITISIASFGQTAPQEMENPYGSRGTRELGLNGSIILPPEYKVDGERTDSGTTTVTLQPFFKYFFRDRIHAGAQLLVQSTTSKPEGGDESGTTVTVFSPHIGYTLPLAPTLQLDAQLNLGFFSLDMKQGDTTINESAFSYGFNLMALAPITQSAVVGVGMIFTWTTLNVENTDMEIFTRVIPIQVSFYF